MIIDLFVEKNSEAKKSVQSKVLDVFFGQEGYVQGGCPEKTVFVKIPICRGLTLTIQHYFLQCLMYGVGLSVKI